MGIGVNFNVLNQKGAPALYEDLFANRPTASYAGRIFLATDTGDLYRDTGTTWFQIATSGGGTPGIDDVLSVQQKFTANRDIDGNNFDFTLFNYKVFKLKNDIAGGETYLHLTNRVITLGDFDSANNRILLSVDDQNQSIQTSGNSGADGLQIAFNISSLNIGFFNQASTWLNIDGGNAKFLSILGGSHDGIGFDFNTQFYRFGVFQNSFTYTSGFYFYANIDLATSDNLIGVRQGANNNFLFANLSTDLYQFGKIYNGAGNKDFCLEIDKTAGTLKTYYADVAYGINFDYPNNIYKYGHPDNYINIDATTKTIQTVLNTLNTGYSLDQSNLYYSFGDYNGTNNNTQIYCDDSNGELGLVMENTFSLSDNGTGNIISATASGSSGDHLVVTINGNQYKIALLNP